MGKTTRDIGVSVRARLMNLARERGQVFDLLLTRYALERLLYRLSISEYRNRFALKGAMLVTTWFADDGISFDGEGLSSRPIREELEYGGVCLQTTATLARARP